jgi:hypothetical protein
MKRIERILGYGIPPRVFKEKYDSLPEEKRRILERVATRIQTITKLTYETTFSSSPYEYREGSDFTFWRWEISSLQVYLFCTCLDALSGKIKAERFPEWFPKQNLENLDVEKVLVLWEKHQNEYGNRKNFLEFFETLPSQSKSWLTNNIIIQRSNKFEVDTKQKHSEDYFVRMLAEYFYAAWRNPFTHQARTHPVDDRWQIDELDDYYSGIETLAHSVNREWIAQPMEFDLKGDGRKWRLWHKKHLDLITILRVIVQNVVCQRLGVDVTADTIEKSLYALGRLHWLYTFIHSQRINYELIASWKGVKTNYTEEDLSALSDFGIPRLRLKASEKLIEFYWADNISENSLRGRLKEQIKLVRMANSRIDKFYESHPRLEKYDKDLRTSRFREIKQFLSRLSNSPTCKKISRFATHRYDIWLLIRDNAQYESINLERPIMLKSK